MIDDLLLTAGLLMPPGSFALPAHFWNYPLRDYQHRMLLEAANLMAAGHRRVVIQAPTGAGKTVMAMALMGSGLAIGWSSEFIVHRRELLGQTSKSFLHHGLHHGFIANKRPFTPDEGVTLAGVQTLVNRLHQIFPPNLVIFDEAHHLRAGTWERVLEAYKDSYIIALTATPERPDGLGLADVGFTALVHGPQVGELIRRGFLSPFEFYSTKIVPDLDGIPTSDGEFVRSAVDAVVDKPQLIGDIVEHYVRLAAGEQGIIFGNSVKHSRHIADMFNGESFGGMKYRAMHVDGTMSEDERTYFDDAFRAGDIRLGCNFDLFGEGYDVPGISYMADAGPRKSEIKIRQRWGRPLRIGGADVAKIVDHVENWKRIMALPDSERWFTLAGRPRKQKDTPDHTPITQCMTCYRVYPSRMSCCPGCASERPAQSRDLKQVEGKLSKIEKEELRQAQISRRKAEEKACKTFKEFVSLGRARGYAKAVGWAISQCKLRRLPIPPRRVTTGG
jgi:DNA repair protein RadD